MRAEPVKESKDRFSVAFAEALDQSRLTSTQLAERIGVNSLSVISQWKSGNRPVPAVYARQLAAMLGVLPESISSPYAKLIEEGFVSSPSEAISGLPPGHVCIDRLHGFCRENAPNFAVLPEFVVRMKFGNTPIEHVRWVLQPTGAMNPTIPQGTLVLIDSTKNSHNDVVDGGLYAYTLYGRPYVRRIIIGRDSWSLCGHDASTERVVIRVTDLEDLRIEGPVLGWL